MNSSTPSFAGLLKQFGDTQLSGVASRDIHTSTAHLILATVFFTGASIGLAKQAKASKKTYLDTLAKFFENHFGINGEKATGMVESNARLYKRYMLIEKVYTAGWEAARDWYQDPNVQSDELKSLLKKYKDLSMSDLSIEGTKEQKVAPAEIEAIIPVASEPVVIETPSHSRRTVLLFILLAEIVCVAYFSLFTNVLESLFTVIGPFIQNIEQQLSELLSPLISPLFSALPLDEWVDKLRSLIP